MKGEVEARTAVVGVGGAGCNVIGEFYWNLPEVDTIAIDFETPSIDSDKRLALQSYATESNGFRENDIRREVAELLRGYEIVYVINGLGGRTGSPISPLVVDTATRSGCMVTSIAIRPNLGAESSFQIEETIDHLRSICPITLVVENGLVPSSIDESMRFDVVNRSIVSYVSKHRDKLVRAFVKNLSKNVKEAFRDEGRLATPFFANCVAN